MILQNEEIIQALSSDNPELVKTDLDYIRDLFKQFQTTKVDQHLYEIREYPTAFEFRDNNDAMHLNISILFSKSISESILGLRINNQIFLCNDTELENIITYFENSCLEGDNQ